jgi:demethylmenaquinone methyltransferase/2-methoxy-6-polyprenyl-1,4-benzoquinol methylase
MSASLAPARPASPPVRQAGHQPTYHEHARSYNRDTGIFQPFRRAVVQALPLRPGHVVLDVGCGTGLCFGLLREGVGPSGTVIGIEKSPEMAALAREHIAREGWRNVTVMLSPAEDARLEAIADAALFCAVHDVLQSPGALRNVMTRLSPGAWVTAGGGKWASPMMVTVNSMVRMLHAPYVQSFSGFDRPWRYLGQLVEDVRVREMAFGSGYVMTGRKPAQVISARQAPALPGHLVS